MSAVGDEALKLAPHCVRPYILVRGRESHPVRLRPLLDTLPLLTDGFTALKARLVLADPILRHHGVEDLRDTLVFLTTSSSTPVSNSAHSITECFDFSGPPFPAAAIAP